MTDVHVDKEFSALCPPLTSEERSLLEQQIKADGCREALIVWRENGKRLLLDGHNRLDICNGHSVQFRVLEKRFDSREDARNFVIANQLGRRNLTDDQKSYLRGKRYVAEKKDAGRPQQERGKNYHIKPERTGERMAVEYGVSEKTIRSDAKFANAVDAVAANAGEQTRRDILSGDLRVSKQDVVRLAELPASEQKAAIKGGVERIRKATGKGRKQTPRFDDEAYLVPCDQLDSWIERRFTKAGGAEARDDAQKLLGQLKRSIEQWRKHKPL